MLFNKEITILDIPSWAVPVVLLLARRLGYSLGITVTLFRSAFGVEEGRSSRPVESIGVDQAKVKADQRRGIRAALVVVRGPGHTLRRDRKLDDDRSERPTLPPRISEPERGQGSVWSARRRSAFQTATRDRSEFRSWCRIIAVHRRGHQGDQIPIPSATLQFGYRRPGAS